MGTDRRRLDSLRTNALNGTTLVLKRGQDERREYVLDHCMPKQGEVGVTWYAKDWIERQFVVKFVLRDDYRTHSIEDEAARIQRLRTRRVAKIDFYGEPVFALASLEATAFYAIIVEYVHGPTLKQYISADGKDITVPLMLSFARALCEVLADLDLQELTHNDLHDENIIITPIIDPLTSDEGHEVMIIDSGSMKTKRRRLDLLDRWRSELEALERAEKNNHVDLIGSRTHLIGLIDWFDRTDQEWVVSHLCALFNALIVRIGDIDVQSRRFLQRFPDLLDRMDDPDPSRRLSDPGEMYRAMESLWQDATQLDEPKMSSPFDLMSAELIRSDRQLLDLFSDEFPGLAECRSSDPLYLYGPRGCGKSTILRSLSTRAILQSKDPLEDFAKVPFVGVYLSCSSELRSRFWLMPESDYEVLEGHVVKYFSFLIVEELLHTLEFMRQWDADPDRRFRFGMTDDAAQDICRSIRQRIGLAVTGSRARAFSHFMFLRSQLRRERDALWACILDRNEPQQRTDAQLIFDVCSTLAENCAHFRTRPIAFLLDDYSNQRIPSALQRRLNQSISFAKQGNPIFKVTSEYGGVDLTGIQEGREVRELNVGLEYISLTNGHRWNFLKDVIERRFGYLNVFVDLVKVLPPSNIGPAVPMAKEIKRCYEAGLPFYYHGIDTISDLCSGDLAMGLDLVRKIFEAAGIDWSKPVPVTPADQHKAIERYAQREHDYIRYLSPWGREKYAVVDRLCWLARESVLKKSTRKNGDNIPVIKIHLDIAESALSELQKQDENHWRMFSDLVQHGVFFPLDTSKSREEHAGTQRFQIRRILLPRYGSPLGRHTPIRIDTVDRLQSLIHSPEEFVKRELDIVSGAPVQSTFPDNEQN